MSPTRNVLLDANVLIPIPLCDTLLRAAEWPLFHPLWSPEILEETRRNLVTKRFTTAEGAARRLAAMKTYWPDATVEHHEPLIPIMRNDAKDRHVLAAAIKGKARIIVTRNIRHFRREALAPYDIAAQTPDAFLEDLYDLSPDAMTVILHQQAAQLRHVPDGIAPIQFVLASLYDCGAKAFAEAMRERTVASLSADIAPAKQP